MTGTTPLTVLTRATAVALLAGAPAAPAQTAAVGRDVSGAFGAVARGAPNPGADGALGALDWDFENLPILPAPPANGPYAVAWSGAWAGFSGVGGVTLGPGANLPAGAVGGVTDPIGGNATVKLRAKVIPPASGAFGAWSRMDIYKDLAPLTRLRIRPDVGQPALAAHEAHVTAITSLWTCEATAASTGFTTGRVLWGGENATTGIGLPIGPITDFYTLGPDPASFLLGVYLPCLYPDGHPSEGEPVPVPVGSWFRLTQEFNVGGEHVIRFDPLDGSGEIEIHRSLAVQVGMLDRLSFRGGFDVADDALYLDNLHVEGVEFVLPTPPPLECSGGQYADDERWLLFGPLGGQSTRWVDALSSRATVVEDAADPTDRLIRRQNVFPDDRYRQEIRVSVPLTVAHLGFPFRACVQVNLLSNPPLPYQTVQAVAPASFADDSIVSRLFIGRFDPGANPAYTPRLYVQINPAYDPVDDESTTTPYAPGPNGNGGLPVIGVDVADTGVDWTFDALRTICFDVAADGALAISLDGVNVHEGDAFVTSVDHIRLESENNNPGDGNVIRYDDVTLTCSTLPPVTLPALTLVYHDDLGWGFGGVTIGLHDDDNDPQTPFRWSSAAQIPLVSSLVDGVSAALKMENRLRDTPAAAPSAPEFRLFEQASTRLPHVTASSTSGWSAECSSRLTDGATSRTWAVIQHAPGGAQRRCAALAISSVTGTFWFQTPNTGTPDPHDTTWVDTGTTLADAGTGLNQFFAISISRHPSQTHTFRINDRLLRFTGGPNDGLAVVAPSLTSSDGVSKDMDRLAFLSSNEDSAPAGSILYADSIGAWSLPCLGDTNNNGVVDFADLNNVLGFFGQTSTGAGGVNLTGNIAPDADTNGVPDDEDPGPGFLHRVNFTDLNTVLSGFGIPCTQMN